MKKILIVEDHIIVRQGVIRVLHDIMGRTLLFDEASDGRQAVEMACAAKYDLILLDLSLPDQNGLDVLKQLHQQFPKLPIIILSTYPEEQYAVRSLRAGAAGYVNKGCPTGVLKETIEKALEGKRHVTPFQADLLLEVIGDDKSELPLHNFLSDRELQFTCMVSTGKTLTQIAQELGISVKTVSTYRTRVLEKLHLKTNAELYNYCMQNKLTV